MFFDVRFDILENLQIELHIELTPCTGLRSPSLFALTYACACYCLWL